jgi:hypothetical protein
MNATDDFAEMIEFKKLCERNTELAHQNLAFRIALRNAAKKFDVSRNRAEAEKIRAILALNPEGV